MKTLILFFTFVLNTFALDVDVSLSTKEAVLGSTFQMVLKFEYSGESEPFISFEPVNAELIGDNTGSNSRVETRVFFSAGKAVQKRIYQYIYEFQPVKPGHAHIREIKIDLGNSVQKLRTQSLKVLSEAKDLADFFVLAETSKDQVYKNEAVELKYYLYTKSEIANIEIKKFPALSKFMKRFEMPKFTIENVNMQGEIYKRILLYQAVVYPEDTGEVTIDQIGITFQYPEYQKRRQDVFGMTMMFSGGSYKTKTMNSKVKRIEVLPLPAEGVPLNFTGLVGDHKFSLKIINEKILVNDVIEARMEVEGDGLLEKFDAPKILENDSLEEFDAKTELIELGNLKVKKVIDYTFLGKKAVTIAGRKIKLSIFDPEKRQYVEKEVAMPDLSVFGTGSSAKEITNSESNTIVPKNQPNIMKPKDIIVAPVFDSGKSKLFELKWLNASVTFIILLVIVSMFNISSIFAFKITSIPLSVKSNYNDIHQFILAYGNTKGTLREIIKNQKISKEACNYLLNLIESIERTEYKNEGKSKLILNKKYLSEYMRAFNDID